MLGHNEMLVDIIDGRRFNWTNGDAVKRGSADISDLTGDHDTDLFKRVYQDSIDQGFAIRSHVTGRVVRFRVERSEKIENEIAYWVFVPCDARLRENGIHVVVYND